LPAVSISRRAEKRSIAEKQGKETKEGRKEGREGKVKTRKEKKKIVGKASHFEELE
jgi:hypothetical protein